MERRTHAYDGPLALFLIGLRVHKPWRVAIVGNAVRAMARMLAELERNKTASQHQESEPLGYLGGRFCADLAGVTLIQWWQGTDRLYDYANAEDLTHRPAWLDFYRAARADPTAVTIWHETYPVAPGGAESLYAGPKPFGLAALAGTVAVERRGQTARDRLTATHHDA